jgi:hypothetical protein
MRIPHLTRQHTSKFFGVVKPKLPATRQLRKGESIKCDLGVSGGYHGRVLLRITDGSEFDTDWESTDGIDWSRFPARIRAAATALRDSGQRGSFLITHADGDLTIKPA